MKDGLSLLAAALLYAGIAWTFWHYLGPDAFAVLPSIGLVVFAIDNRRLRRQLRDRKGDAP